MVRVPTPKDLVFCWLDKRWGNCINLVIWQRSLIYCDWIINFWCTNYKWYIPSEKVGQFFWPPKNVFFAIHFQYWTSGNAFWPFLAHPAPWGVSGGVGGGQGGSVGPKFSNFFGATFGFQNAKFWIVWTENTPFSSFLAKFSPSGDQKCPFWAEMVEHKSAFFSKTSSLNCLKMHQNKVLGSILM